LIKLRQFEAVVTLTNTFFPSFAKEALGTCECKKQRDFALVSHDHLVWDNAFSAEAFTARDASPSLLSKRELRVG